MYKHISQHCVTWKNKSINLQLLKSRSSKLVLVTVRAITAVSAVICSRLVTAVLPQDVGPIPDITSSPYATTVDIVPILAVLRYAVTVTAGVPASDPITVHSRVQTSCSAVPRRLLSVIDERDTRTLLLTTTMSQAALQLWPTGHKTDTDSPPAANRL